MNLDKCFKKLLYDGKNPKTDNFKNYLVLALVITLLGWVMIRLHRYAELVLIIFVSFLTQILYCMSKSEMNEEGTKGVAIMYSILVGWTLVYAFGNKDFIAGFIALAFFVIVLTPCILYNVKILDDKVKNGKSCRKFLFSVLLGIGIAVPCFLYIPEYA